MDLKHAISILKDIAEQLNKVEYRLHVTKVEVSAQNLFAMSVKVIVEILR